MRTTRRATLATKLLLPAFAALALVGAWTALAPAQDDAPTAPGHIVLDAGPDEKIVFREIVEMTSEAVPGDKRDEPKRPVVVLRRGLDRNDALWRWHGQVRAGDASARRDATLSLYDAQNGLVASWRLADARPTKIVVGTLNATGNEVAIETIELTGRGIDIGTIDGQPIRP